ncbi:MAG TPA: hypothetical protein VNZ26_34735, partial [Vicinamibacterales bacterium]|nr:hypothetical protein [Vicinamibacterales bacterium]
IVFLILPYGFSPIYRFPSPQPFTGSQLRNPYANLRGRWLRANLHAHGNVWGGMTSGRQTDTEVVHAYRTRQYDIAGLSNYQHISTSDLVPTLPIYEHGFNIGKRHQLAIGAKRVDWFDFPFWQGINQKQYVIDRLRRSTELVAIAHPFILQRYSYPSQDFERLTSYDLIEVVNGRFADEGPWDAALSAGRAVWAIGGDDTHDVTDPNRMAVAWNMIDAANTSDTTLGKDVIDALRQGRSYVVSKRLDSDSPSVQIARAAKRPIGSAGVNGDVGLAGVTVSANSIRVACIGGPATISFVGQNGDVRKRVEDVASAEYSFAPNDTYVRVVVRSGETILYLNPIIRYDGNSLPAPNAAIDPLMTWVFRLALLFGCGAIVWEIWGRHRPPDRGSSALAPGSQVNHVYQRAARTASR